MRQDVVEQHQPAGDHRWTRVAAVTTLLLADRRAEAATEQVVDAAAVGAKGHSVRQLPFDKAVQEAPHVLSAFHSGEGGVLTTKAIAAVEERRSGETPPGAG